MGRLDNCYNLADLRDAAKRRLPRGVFEFVDKGSEDHLAMANNRAAFERIKLLNKVLVNVDELSLESELFGKPMGMPLAISPTGLAGFCWFEGELALAKAAKKAGIPYTLASGAVTSIETLAAEAGGRLWFQHYLWRDRALSYQVIERARDAGFEALMITVDTGLGGNREHNKRNGFSMPYRFSRKNVPDLMMHPGWLARVILPYVMKSGMPRHENYPDGLQSILAGVGKTKSHSMRGENTTWDDIPKIRQMWPGPFMVKGILRKDDAVRAVEAGADGIIVSNHGGRNMDSAVATIDVLPSIVEAVGGKATVILDSGIRRGSDVAKALALGAKAVMMGRGTLFGTAVAGEAGATHALDIVRNEFRHTMGYVGCSKVSDISPDILAEPPDA